MATILLVDDNPFNREGMRLYLEQHDFFVLEAGDEQSAWQLATANQLHTAVVDIVIPATATGQAHTDESRGVALAIRLKTNYPDLGIVLFSAYEDRGKGVFGLVEKGFRGIAYKLKGSQPAELLAAVKAVQAGRVLIDPEISKFRALTASFTAHLTPEESLWVEEAANRLRNLSRREMETAQRIAAAQTVERIAAALGVTPKTVENYTNRIYHKLGLNNLQDETLQLRKPIILAKACMLYDFEHQYATDDK